MFKALLRLQLAVLLNSFNGTRRSQKNSSKLKTVGLALLMLYAYFAFMFLAGTLFSQLAQAFYPAGIGWLYFTFAAITAFALMFIGSIFVAKAQLYEAKDNDLLLSMPIPPSYILGSRMMMLLVLNLFLELIVMLPAGIMWGRFAPFSFGSVLCYVLLVLGLPFFSMALSGLFGWLLALLSDRVRNKSLMTVLFSVAFLIVYFMFFSRANDYITKLIASGRAIAASFEGISPLFWLGNAVAQPDYLHLLLSLLILIVPFILMYWLLSVTFIKVATTARGTEKIRYKHKALRASSQASALLRREFQHLLSSPAYILNAGLGVLFILAVPVVLAIKKAQALSLLSQTGIGGDLVVVILALGLCLLNSTVLFTASSVSLEGKTLWAIKSLPVGTTDILRAKLRMHDYLTLVPIVLASVSVIFLLKLQAPVLLLVVPVVYVKLSSCIGLMFNLNHPVLEWTNETQVIKQSISVLLTMLINAVLVIAPGAAYLLLRDRLDAQVFLAAYGALLAAGWFFCNRWLMTKGAEKFEMMG